MAQTKYSHFPITEEMQDLRDKLHTERSWTTIAILGLRVALEIDGRSVSPKDVEREVLKDDSIIKSLEEQLNEI